MSKKLFGKRFMAIFMSIAIAVTFMPAIPGVGIGGAQETYAATVPTDFNGMTWEITDEGVLKLGSESGDQTLTMPASNVSLNS